MSQLALPLKLRDHAVFESFWTAGNEQLVAYLTDLAGRGHGPGCWIWGPRATGRTHLLQAVCGRLGDRAVYLPLREISAGPPILDGLASRGFVCLDDLDVIVGQRDWESGLFDLCNQLTDHDGTLVVSAANTTRESGISMPDLQSRLSLLPAFRIRPLAEAERLKALQLRARHRGLDLPAETGRFLLTRSRRDMSSLYEALDRLDGEALKAKRRLTIPFVRDVLDL